MKDTKLSEGCDTSEVTVDEIFSAYLACRRNKRGKPSALDYEIDYETRLLALRDALNNRTYKVGKSIVFAVRFPKPREVFAADFEDRIVHHLIVNRLLPVIEYEFINDTYNCRIRKGNLYGIHRLRDAIMRISNGYTTPCYALCLDIHGFFMSIDRDILYQKVCNLIDRHYAGNKDWVKWLAGVIISNRPEKNCEKRGDFKLLASLPKEKSLLKDGRTGLPIGNLTSQIFANLYLSDFDHVMTDRMGIDGFYGRYVDDFRFVSRDKKLLLSLICDIRDMLAELGLTLHPNKIHLVDVTKGVPFVGYVIKPGRIYMRSRTVHRSFRSIERWNKYATEQGEEWAANNVETFVAHANCYFAIMAQANTYGYRRQMWKQIDHSLKDHLYTPSSVASLHVVAKDKNSVKRIKSVCNERSRLIRKRRRNRLLRLD